jgi:SAM-dependent methyltransferase
MFNAVDDWTTSFVVDGVTVGGWAGLDADPRLLWNLEAVGGAGGRRVLELGSFEGAHSKMLVEQEVDEVTAIEGFRPAWLRSLVVKEIFELKRVRFLFGDFCAYVTEYDGPPFDFVVASGVLYHQVNPAQLIRDLARITDRVLVWSQVADETSPPGPETLVGSGDRSYRGRLHSYGRSRDRDGYCAGVRESAVWLFPDDLFAAFRDAGFAFFGRHPDHRTVYGAAVLFAASKHDELRVPDWQAT